MPHVPWLLQLKLLDLSYTNIQVCYTHKQSQTSAVPGTQRLLCLGPLHAQIGLSATAQAAGPLLHQHPGLLHSQATPTSISRFVTLRSTVKP